MSEFPELTRCGTCNAPIPFAAPGGQCPLCLLSLGTVEGLTAAADEALLDGGQLRQFGDYELCEEIARGGMGIVYRAWQISAQREVAVKMILTGQLATPESVARFRNEAATAALLDHPNIVPVYEIGEFETQHYFSMRYVPGGRNIATWARALPVGQRFQALGLAMAEVARAVAFAHERGVLHRDLKPSNILIDEADEPQVTDFGLAKLLDSDATALTLSSAILGSPSYMAPEQAEGRAREITTATDVYGLGAVLYELLEGRPPFQGSSPLIVARRVVEEAPRRLQAAPADLATLCLKCLAKEPHERYPSALALAEDLERFARGQPVEAQPLSTFGMVRAWARRKPAIASLLSALFLALLGGLGGVFWQWRHAEAARAAETTANVQLRDTISHLEWRAIDVLLDRDYAPRALAELAERLRTDPQSWQAASYAISLIEQHPFALPAGPDISIPAGAPEPQPALSRNGRWIAYLQKPERIRVVDPTSGRDLFAPLECTGSTFNKFAFSPDDTLLAAATGDGAITLWEMPSGRLISRTGTGIAPLRTFAFSGDGQTIVAGGGGSIVVGTITEFRAGVQPQRTLVAGFEPASLRCSSDGSRIAAWSAKKDQPLCVWGPAGSGPPWSPPAPEVRGADLAPTGEILAVRTGEFEVQIWNVAERRLISTVQSELSDINEARLTPDGKRLAVGLRGGAARIFSTASGLPASRVMPHLYQLTALSLDGSGTRLATSGWDYRARLWEVATGNPLCEPIPHRGDVLSIATSNDGHRLLTYAEEAGSKNHHLQLWQVPGRVEPETFQPTGGRDLDGAYLSPDGRYLAVGSPYPTSSLTVFEVATHRVLLDREPTIGGPYVNEFSPDCRRLYMLTNRGSCRAWSVPDFRPLWPDQQLPSGLQPGALSPNGRWLAAGCTDGVLRLIDTESGKIARECRHGALLKSVRFTRDSARMVTAGADGIANIWNPETGERLATMRGHRHTIISTAFSTDGARLTTASYDGTARLWDVASGAQLGATMVHGGEGSYAIFSPDGSRVATGSRDGTARIWDAFTGAPLIDAIARPDAMQTVQFHPDGRRWLTMDHGGFRLWDAQTGEAVTVQYRAPVAGGLGVDSPSFRESFTPDSRRVILSNAHNEVSLWPIPDPPAPVPAWFPDLLDAIATGGIGSPVASAPAKGNLLLEWRERAQRFGNSDFYEAWTRRYFGLATK